MSAASYGLPTLIWPFGTARPEYSTCMSLWKRNLPPAGMDYESQVICLDWYATHSCPDVRNLIAERGHALLLYGGGTTSIVQMSDTHSHAFFQTFARHALPQ